MPSSTLFPFDVIFRDAPDGLVVIDGTAIVVLANSRAESLFGCSIGGLIGRRLETLFSGLDPVAYAEFLSSESGVFVALAVGAGEATSIVVEVASARLGSPERLTLLALRDVTAWKQNETVLQARARQQSLVAELGRQALTGIESDQLMNEAVAVLASDLGVEYVNLLELFPDGTAAFRAGIGWREGLVGEMTAELQPGTPAAEVLFKQAPVLIEDLRADDHHPAPSFARDHGVVSSLTVPVYGQARPLGVLGVHTGSPRRFLDGEVHFVQAVANVVATAMERHRHEERLRERQMVRAEQMAAIGQVAAGVAHELRNPLTSIKGLVQVNLREADAQSLPTEDLRVIEHEIRRMERTLQTFLDFARPPRPDRRRLDLTEVADRVVALVGGRARKQDVDLRIDRAEGPVWVDGDQDQLQQLLLNLVLNALDAMPHGGMVDVEFRPPRDGQVELLVRDTGPGLAAQILPKVFETFVSSKETGIGLGLPVSRRIAEDHGGTLSAYNLPAGGACFALRLPTPI